ncbi:MAG TPA: sirohydrochlorin chelatase [Microlunatus sp.]|nr:sirohydrochlorin chelatase [Microlunatus sp.]
MSRSGPTLIGLAHGSRHARVAEGVRAVLDTVTETTGIPSVAAYLDLTAPDLQTVAAELAGRGEQTAVVVPLLFTDAFHARVDVPDAVAEAARTSGLHLELAPILGTGDDLAEVVAGRLSTTGTRAGEPVLLYAVGSSRPEANAAVAGLAERLSARRGGPVRAGFGTSAPRASDVLAELVAAADGSGTVVPLFVAPGLLLDGFEPTVRAAGWRLADPLGTLLAPLVSHRYASVRNQRGLH